MTFFSSKQELLVPAAEALASEYVTHSERSGRLQIFCVCFMLFSKAALEGIAVLEFYIKHLHFKITRSV